MTASNNTSEEIKERPLDLEEKVKVTSIADWEVEFNRLEGLGSIRFSGQGSVRIPRSEIIAQVQNNNKLFCGIDGKGSHATLFIDDVPTRIEVGFESKDGKIKQVVFGDDVVVKLFNCKNQATFESSLKETIKTRSEKFALIKAIPRLKINDFSKIRFAEQYTGFKVD